MAYRSFWALSSLLAALVLTACEPSLDFADLAVRRLVQAERGQGPVRVGVVWPSTGDLFREGIALAEAEINASEDGILGHPLEIHYLNDFRRFEEARSSIRRLVRDTTLISVIGHREPEVAIPASLIYEQSGILYLAPFITNQRLTAHGFQLVFRMVPGNELLAEQLISLCNHLGYRRLVVLHSRDAEHREQATLFLDRALKSGLAIDTQISFFDNTQNFRDAIARFRNHRFDAIFIAGGDRFGGRLVSQIRELGIALPIIGVDTMDSMEFLLTAGVAAEGVILPTVYYPASGTNINEQFVSRFQERYGIPPDVYAAQAYDSLHLLAHTIRRTRSRTPVVMASTLRFLPFWIGVTGVHAFDTRGNVEGKKFYFKIRRDESWEILIGAHTAFTIQRFLEYLEERDAAGGPDEVQTPPTTPPSNAPRASP